MDVRARCLKTFKDGNIFRETVKIGQVIVVTESEYSQIVASGGMFEVLAKIVPAPVREDGKAKS